MDKTTRNSIERFTQKARMLLEEDFYTQLAATYDIRQSHAFPESPGRHLSARQKSEFRRILASLTHKAASGMPDPAALADYVRDTSFTMLNRLVALKMLEKQGLLRECISRGSNSSGYNEFALLAEGLRTLPNGAGYRLYLECVFDEMSSEIKVLFDRNDAASVLWPSHQAFTQLLDRINSEDLATVWGQEETIGWVYQYFNSIEERRKMREESQAPRNSRELAVRNQFFTPDYVVRFLSDNTLGRIWYGMTNGKTKLADSCEYMVKDTEKELADRPKKDPRDIRVLDPACGSGHFLLRAFEMFLVIYEEAWEEQWAVVSGQWEVDSGQGIVGSGQWSVKSGQVSGGREGNWGERGAKASAGEELQGADRVAESHGSGGAGIQDDESFSERGALWADCPDSPGGHLGSFEHRRRAGSEYDQGLSQLPGDSLRFSSGSGDSVPSCSTPGIHGQRGSSVHPATCIGSGALDQRAVCIALEKAGYHYSLTTAHPLFPTDHSSLPTDHLHPPSDHSPLPTDHSPLILDFPTKEALRRELPGLILRHNLHGVDIDPRCAQIAQLALWMRAQKAFQDFGVEKADRPVIRRSNIVIAEPMPGEKDLLDEFSRQLENPTVKARFDRIAGELDLAGDLGLLLKLEKLSQSRAEYQLDAFEPPDDAIRVSLERFLDEATAQQQARRRLFAEDSGQGLGLVELAEQRYDVILMNPPFGTGSAKAKKHFEKAYPRTKNDVYAAFVERGIELLNPGGMLGAITSRTGFFLSSFQKWREEIILKQAPPVVFADLGAGVLDSAMVETAAYCLEVKP
jgi:hypothetical protein